MGQMPFSASADGRELAVIQGVRSAWEASLPSIPFAPEKSWADIGVDSLKALEFVLRLERTLKMRVGFDAMAPECTAFDLVRLLAREPDTHAAAEAPQPVFLVPGIFGDEPRLAHFRKTLSGEVQFETLELPDLDCPARLIGNIARTAARLVEQVNGLQPEGDLLLAGYSFGCLVAQDMACQLEARGRTVTFLALLDGLVRPRTPQEMGAESSMAASTLSVAMATRISSVIRYPWETIAGTLREKKNSLRSAIDTWQGWRSFLDRAIFSVLMDINAWEAARRFLVSAAHRHNWSWMSGRRRLLILRLRAWAILRWSPGVAKAPTLLVTSDELASDASVEEWQTACPHLRHVPVKSEHLRIFESPAMAVITPAFLQALAVARRNVRALA
jgi:thioesterase domain-containing protein